MVDIFMYLYGFSRASIHTETIIICQ